jgi:hypothetical protein
VKNPLVTVLMLSSLAVALPITALAQSAPFQVGVHVTAADSTEFDEIDVGFGGRVSWNPMATVGIESELTFMPGDFPDRLAFSASRVESLSGITLGPRLGGVRPFARLRAGFLRYAEAPQPLVCIAIFPPPLTCEMASGLTVAAFDVGGGIEVSTGGATFVRADLGDRMLKYPGPASSGGRLIPDGGVIGHDFRFALGGGFKF